MPIHSGLKELGIYQGCYLSIGNFDGVHLGHQAILQHLVSLAKSNSAPSVVLTFEPHPIILLRPEVAPPRLTTLEEKAKLILQTGVDHVVVYPTDSDFLNLSASDFFEKIILDHFQARGLVEGPNFFFGKNRAGNVETLKKLCSESQLSLDILSPELINGEMTSSSAIRKAIKQGEIKLANKQLGRFYSLSGIVAQGDQRGRTIGFPTANMSEVETMIPADGVYAARVNVSEESYSAAVNIGPNPTFGVETKKIEAHLLSFENDLYGQKLEIEFVEKIRNIQSFANADELKTQISRDVEQIQSLLSGC